GLDTEFFAGCDFSAGLDDVAALRVDLREVEQDALTGFDAVIHLAALSNDPLGDLNPDCTYDINHRASVRLARLAKAAGVSRLLLPFAMPLVRLGRRRWALGRGPPVHPRDRIRRLQDSGRARRGAPGRCDVQPDLLAQCHRLWRIATAPHRPGRQQPGR